MFEHEIFDKYDFEEVPLDRDIYVVDETYMQEYEQVMLRVFEDGGDEYEPVGYVSFVAARRINENSIDLTWYANSDNRWHEIEISLPRDKFRCCVGSWQWDEKPRIFAETDWVYSIHTRSHSIFALIDAIGMKNALYAGNISRERLVNLRNRIDRLSSEFQHVSFISFADSLLLKSNWTVGHVGGSTTYTYDPELFIDLSNRINLIYQEELGLSTYSVIAQGANEFYEDAILHTSKIGNHISLNSLGLPFAQLLEIETTARNNIREGNHAPAEFYLDEQYYRSLRLQYGFEKDKQPHASYRARMMDAPCKYFCISHAEIAANLQSAM